MINQKGEVVNQEVHLVDRAKGYVTGVLDVVSFDLEEIVLETVAGILKIQGNKLHVKAVNLDKKIIEFEGNVNEMCYADSKEMKRKSIMGRLFG